ncbi:hypothetical protein BV911_14670 [Pseudoruegeria sp. SK021]|nr:hypothetical protein BV911_14670 [Pseudoruegeria sp. SK021]
MGDVLDRAEGAADVDQPSFGDLVEAMGRSSLTAILLLVSLAIITPLSGIPGVSASGGVIIALVSAQIIMGRERAWFPKWLLRQSLPGHRVRTAIDTIRKPATVVDRHVHRRMQWISGTLARRVLGAICLGLGLAMPGLELVPFSSSIAGLMVALLALAMLAQDGLLVLAALGVCLGAGTLVIQLFSGG